jgi:hypothetical protein
MEDQRKRLERIENKVDTISEKVSDINSTLAAQHVSLEHHIKRTDLLEAQVIPLRGHADELKGVVRFLKILGLLLTILEALRHFYK